MAQILFAQPGADQQVLRNIVDQQRQVSRARRMVTPGLALNAATLAVAYPNMDSGQIVGLALGGESPGSPTAEMVSERQLLQTQASDVNKPAEEEGWFDDFVYDPFKGLIRGAFTVLNAGIEEAESLLVRSPIAAYQGQGNAIAAGGRSDAWHALSNALDGAPVNLGEGFFPESTVSEDVQAKLAEGMSLADAMAGSSEQQALGTPVTVEGTMDRERLKLTHSSGKQVPISFGRAAAINFTEPGTRGFQYLSGFADAFKQVALDPADLVLGGAGKARKLSKLVGNADDANILSKAARSALLGDSRKSFFQTNWDDYLTSEQGAGFVGRINDATGDEGFGQIYDLYRGTQKSVDPGDIRQLADSTDYQNTYNLIRDLGSKQQDAFKKFGRIGFGAQSSGTAIPRIIPQALAGPVRKAPATAMAGAFGMAEAAVQTIGSPISSLRTAGRSLDIPMQKLLADAYETGLGFSIRQSSTGTYLGRLAASTSAQSLNVNDQVQAMEEMNQYFRGLGLDRADYDRLMYKASDPFKEWEKAKAAGDDGYDMFAHYFGVLKEANDLWADGIRASDPNFSEVALQSIGNMFNSNDAMRSFWVNNVGEDVFFGNARVTYLSDGEAKAMPSALLFSQFMEQNIPLMDSRKIRATQRRSWWADKTKVDSLKKIFGPDDYDDIGENALMSVADFTVSKLWKPAVLLRMAWPVRVIGEEQFRLSGDLLSGAVNHPLQFISIMMAKDNKLLGKLSRLDNDALGRAFMDAAEHDAAMSKSLAGMTGGNKASRWEARTKGQLGKRGAAEAHVNSVNQMRNDELTVLIAGRSYDEFVETGGVSTAPLQDIKDRWWNGDLEYMRRNMVQDSKRMEIMNVRADADAYIDDVFSHLLHQSGGRGRMLNRHTNEWMDFDGQKTAASAMPDARTSQAVTEQRTSAEALESGQGAIEALQAGEDPQMIASGIADNLAALTDNTAPVEDAEAILQALEDRLVKMLDHPMAVNAVSSTESGIDNAIDTASRKLGLTDSYETQRLQGVKQTGNKEMIRSQEVLEGPNALRQGDYRKLHKSPGLGQKIDTNNASLNIRGEAMKESLPQTEVEELANIGRDEYRTFTMQEIDNHVTVTFGENGIPTASVQWEKIDGDIHIQMMQGIDNRGINALMDDMAKQGDMSQAQLLDAYVGDQRFLDFMNEALEGGPTELPENIKTYDQLHAWIRKNPEAMKTIETSFMRFNDEVAAMTSSGVGMHRRIAGKADRAGGEGAVRTAAKEAPQHRAYIEIDELGDPRMFELIATGGIVDDGFSWGDNVVGSGVKKQFNERANYFDDDGWFDTMPEYLRKPMDNDNADKVAVWDRAVGTLMDMLMSKPTNKLSRSPAFRQFYWKRMSQMYQNSDDGIRDSLRITAAEAGLTDSRVLDVGKPIRAIRRASGREVAMDESIRRFGEAARPAGADIVWEVGTNGDVTLREMDEIAKAYALQETKGLLYDMSNDHNWSDMARIVMPFGEAWYEVMSTWGKLISENPRNIRRIQQGIQGAQDSNPFVGTGPDGEQGQGFFYRDPTTGEEVFNYPGSGVIANWMLGDAAEAVSLKGRVAGVSLMSQVLPGIGPAVQIPISQMGWTDDPDNRMMRDLLLPFGKSKVEVKDPTSWLSPLLPAWVNKGVAAYFGEESYGENKRLYMNTTMDVYKTLLMNGWSDGTEEDMKRTLAEAGRISKRLTFIKAMSSFAAPTSAAELWQVKYDSADDDGEMWAYQNLATAYRQILEDVDGDDVQAYKKFTDLFGVDPMLFTTAKTQRVMPRAVTLESRKWEYDNKDLYEIDKYPGTAYFARPDGVDGEFDYETYILTLKDGTRQPLTAEQWAQRRNQMLGKVAYANFQRTADRRFRDANMSQQWLRQQQSSLMAYFPGYGREIPGLPATFDLNTQIQELYRWDQDDRLKFSSVGQSLEKYLAMRDNVVRRTMATYGYKTDTGWRTGKNAVMYRAQLKGYGQKLAQENPDFVPIFTQILLRELQEPEAGQAPVELAGVSF